MEIKVSLAVLDWRRRGVARTCRKRWSDLRFAGTSLWESIHFSSTQFVNKQYRSASLFAKSKAAWISKSTMIVGRWKAKRCSNGYSTVNLWSILPRPGGKPVCSAWFALHACCMIRENVTAGCGEANHQLHSSFRSHPMFSNRWFGWVWTNYGNFSWRLHVSPRKFITVPGSRDPNGRLHWIHVSVWALLHYNRD